MLLCNIAVIFSVRLSYVINGYIRFDDTFHSMLNLFAFYLFCFCFQAVDLNSELVCIHDSARTLASSGDIEKVWLCYTLIWCSGFSC